VKRAKVATLPPAVKQWLDKALLAGNFSGYEKLSEELKARGYSIGKSAVHRYGSNLERKMSAIKASTEAAKLIAQEAPDDADLRSAAVISMIQTEAFNVMVSMQEMQDEPDPVARAGILAKMAKNLATLTRASVAQKKHEIEIRDKLAAAADRVARIAKKGGLTAAGVDNIRREILGIAG
jgi:hypothetical protein